LIDKQKAGTRNETSIFAAFDIVPSLLAIAGVKPMDPIDFDGEDVSSTLLGKSEASRSKPIFWRRPPDRKTASDKLPERLPDLAMRDGNWKFLCDYDGSRPQLYDLSKDQAETTNLASQHPDRVNLMSHAVLSWHGALPPDNGPALGALKASTKSK
jgi:uncharacterized sulfatase